MKSEIETLKQVLAEERQKNTRLQGEVERANGEETRMHGECAKAWALLAEEQQKNTPLKTALLAVVEFLDAHGACPNCGAPFGEAGDLLAEENGEECCDEGRALRRRLLATLAATPSEAPSSGSDKSGGAPK